VDSVRQILIRQINRTALLTQEDLNQTFAKARLLIDHCLELLVAVSYHAQYYYVDQAMEILTGIDRNRAIYKKTAPFEGSIVDYTREGNNTTFLCSSMDMMSAIIRNDIISQQEIILHNNISRAVFYHCLEDWLAWTQDYDKLAEASVEYHFAGELEQHSELELELLYREQAVEAYKPGQIYGVYRFVAKRMEAIDYLYSKVLEAYSRIVLQTASASAGSEAQANDSFQNGSFGLLRATHSYDHCSYVRFSNFARWWIRQAVLYHLKDEANCVRIPISTWQHYNDLQRLRYQFESQYGSQSDEDFAKQAGLKPEYITKVYAAIRLVEMRSLDKPLSNEEGSQTFTRANKIADEQFEEQGVQAEAQSHTAKFVEHLTTNERLVVCLFYGLFDQLPEKTSPIRDFDVFAEKLRQRFIAKKLAMVKRDEVDSQDS